ncbi:Guanine nucleotide exchange factor, Ric8 [Lasallia pustulata]|uniref:Guanine nucleotide exchange factor, Ric8 n=1 Tax=Lasallia pustulata TaxID=136370 RepID=A0A1W5CSF2_9LECA|nr:Guanine nucleotide exchange factor, Ric8 [Lasallia pustulata]
MSGPAKTSATASVSNVSNGTSNLKDVTKLAQVLDLDLQEKNLSPAERYAAVGQLKLFTRKLEDAGPLLTEEGIRILSRHGFDSAPTIASRDALRCLANLFLLDPKARQIFVDLKFADKAAERLKNDNRDDEFLVSRILFLMTYDTNLNFDGLFEHHQLSESINKNIAHLSNFYSVSRPRKERSPSTLDTLALSETLKLLFNLTQYYPHRSPSFTPSLAHILKILCRLDLPSPALRPPVNYLINALLNLDIVNENDPSNSTSNPFFPAFDPKCNAERLIHILDNTVRDHNHQEEDLERTAPPLISLLRKVFDSAPASVKIHMQTRLLPTDDERPLALGRSPSLASHLLRLSTSAVAPNLRETISQLLFDLSDRDATTFVRNVGYGFASGFLMTHDFPVPAAALRGEDLGEMVTTVDGREINPVTGQRRDMEPEGEEAEMTEEEKEREAERLFVLFERLKATGVVDVQNPVAQAAQEGRFEEVD